MFIVPAIMAAALTLDLQGLTVITPWKSPTESTARVWVFLPNTSQHPGMPPHRATLVLDKSAVVADDWHPNSPGQGNTGVWNLEGYVLSVYREGVTESPNQLYTWAVGSEPHPWESLRWVLNLDRVAPEARIVSNPFAHAIAAIKLSDGDLNGAPPKTTNPSQIWVVEPAVPKYQQAFTDTVRYTIDLKDRAAELRLEPVPGGKQPPKRIRLVTGKNVAATLAHVPERPSTVVNGHASAAAGLMDGASHDKVAGIKVRRGDTDMGGDPLCDALVVHIPVPPGGGGCIRCAISLGPAGVR
jgi:hypothetical protein